MALRLFGNGNSTNHVKHFEIRLDQSTLILRGNEDEASSALLKGTLVLCLSEPLRAPSIRLRFTGEKRAGWDSSHAKKDEVFVRHTWEFLNTGSRRGETLAAGNYEWPFDYILPGHTPESVEGLQGSWIIYRMKATVERGILAQNILARKHVRIVRTLATAALELFHEMAVDNTWANKIDYTLSTPTKAVIFGTTVQVDFRIASLLKGLKIGEVSLKISETQDVTIDTRRQGKRSKIRVTRDIAEDKFEFPQDQETVLIDGQDSWVFTRQINLPKSLSKCLQTVDARGIKTRHSLLFNVKLINPDQHVSELHASLPLYIYISPNLLLDESNNTIMHNLSGVDPEAFAVGAPPTYGDHQMDMLYNDLDPAGYMTPAGGPSGIGTPFSQSRRGSADNLASMNVVASSGVLPTALQNRLSYIGNTSNVSAAPTPAQDTTNSTYDSPPAGVNDGPRREDLTDTSEHPQDSGNDQYRRMSENDSEHSESGPQHFEFSPEQLSKVPSYSTALRSPHQTPISEVPPTYQSLSRPPPSQVLLI